MNTTPTNTATSPIRVIVTGISGRMGTSNTLGILNRREKFTLVGATDAADSPVVGRDAGEVVGRGTLGVTVSGSLSSAWAQSGGADVVLDFTQPKASLQHAQICASLHVPLVVGTTGFSEDERQQLIELSKDIALVVAPNMSVGVVAMQKLVQRASQILSEGYDVEILEAHHRHKKDAPSGTALKLGAIAADVLGRKKDDLKLSREGLVGTRSDSEIGIQSLRGGDCVGEHTVFFFGTGERLEITHRAFSRDQFTQGALRAIAWVVGKPVGLYDMEDVLGLK